MQHNHVYKYVVIHYNLNLNKMIYANYPLHVQHIKIHETVYACFAANPKLFHLAMCCS